MEDLGTCQPPAATSPPLSPGLDFQPGKGLEHLARIEAGTACDDPSSKICEELQRLLEQHQHQLRSMLDAWMARQERILEQALSSRDAPMAQKSSLLSKRVRLASVKTSASAESSLSATSFASCAKMGLMLPKPFRSDVEAEPEGRSLNLPVPQERSCIELAHQGNSLSPRTIMSEDSERPSRGARGPDRTAQQTSHVTGWRGGGGRRGDNVPEKFASMFNGFSSGISVRMPSTSPSIYVKPQVKEDQRWSLREIAKSTRFEFFILLAILTNSIFIGIEVNYLATSGRMQSPPHFYVIQHMYSVIFLSELVLRIWIHQRNFFLPEVRGWNIFDTMLVLCSLLEASIDIMEVSPGGYGVKQLDNMGSLRIARIFRVTRVVRIFRISRVVRFVQALRTLVYSIVCSLKSVVWALLLLLLIIYCFAILFTQAVVDHCNPKRLQIPAEHCDAAFGKWWSELLLSMFTLFKCISGGVSWTEVVTPLGEVSFLCTLMFCAYVSFTYFAVLNVVTGVFCQSAFESAQRDRDLVVSSMLAKKQDFVSEIQKLFKQIDADHSGTITVEEFENHIQDDAVQAYFAALELETSDAWTFFRLLDTEKTEAIDVEEFVLGCLRMKGAAKGIDLAKLLYEQKRMMRGLQLFVEHLDRLMFGRDLGEGQGTRASVQRSTVLL